MDTTPSTPGEVREDTRPFYRVCVIEDDEMGDEVISTSMHQDLDDLVTTLKKDFRKPCVRLMVFRERIAISVGPRRHLLLPSGPVPLFDDQAPDLTPDPDLG